jgi:hypothetical protein
MGVNESGHEILAYSALTGDQHFHRSGGGAKGVRSELFKMSASTDQ